MRVLEYLGGFGFYGLRFGALGLGFDSRVWGLSAVFGAFFS